MINLWSGFAIDADSYQYILGKVSSLVDKRTGKVRTSLDYPTYHPTIGHALLAFHGMQLREGIERETHTIMSAIALSNELEKRILALAETPKTISSNDYKYIDIKLDQY